MKKALFIAILGLFMLPGALVAQTLAGKPIAYYLKHKQISQRAKDLYTGQARISDDESTLAIMDSLFTKNTLTRPFYFLVLTRTMKKADGAYGEPLGAAAKRFVEEYTLEFVRYFAREPLLTKDDFEQWAGSVAGEIQISAEGKESAAVDQFGKITQNNCVTCTKLEKQRLIDFLRAVRKYSL